MKNNFFYEKGYTPDEGEIYLNNRMQGKTEERNKALFLFLSIAVPILSLLLLIYEIKKIFF